jgi:hypothetical protein
MSEKFGLDWKKYSNKRMNDFIIIASIRNKLENEQGKKISKGRK